MSNLVLYDFCLKRDCAYEERGTVSKIVVALLSLIHGYNEKVKEFFEKDNITLPELILSYYFEPEKIRLRLTCKLNEVQTGILEERDRLEKLNKVLELEIAQRNSDISNLKKLLKDKEKELENKECKLKEEWQKIQSITYRPEARTLSEEELKDKIYKEYMSTYLPDFKPKEE